MDLTRAREVEDATMMASTHEDAEGLVQKVALLEGGFRDEASGAVRGHFPSVSS
jgi:hypothetical protein